MNLALTAGDARFLRTLLDGYRTAQLAPYRTLRNPRGQVVVHAKPLPADVERDVARVSALLAPIDAYLRELPWGV